MAANTYYQKLSSAPGGESGANMWTWDGQQYMYGLVSPTHGTGTLPQYVHLARYDALAETWSKMTDPPFTSFEYSGGGSVIMRHGGGNLWVLRATGDGTKPTQVFMYSIASNTWGQNPDLLPGIEPHQVYGVHYANGGIIGDYFYFGRGLGWNNANNTVQWRKYNLKTGVLSGMAPHPALKAIYDAGEDDGTMDYMRSIAYDGKMWCQGWGSYYGPRSDRLFAYNPVLDSWTEHVAPAIGIPQTGPAFGAGSEKLWVISDAGDLRSYKPGDSGWTSHQPVPSGFNYHRRSNMFTVPSKNLIYSTGNYNLAYEPGTVLTPEPGAQFTGTVEAGSTIYPAPEELPHRFSERDFAGNPSARSVAKKLNESLDSIERQLLALDPEAGTGNPGMEA